jgi:hypothetical protein
MTIIFREPVASLEFTIELGVFCMVLGRNASPTLIAMIRRMSLENPMCGGAKIRDALVNLGYERLDVGTIRNDMKKRSKDPSGTWKAFLRNHMNVSWRMDFCVLPSVEFK